VSVPQSVYYAEFEHGSLPFRKWLEGYCAETGQSLAAAHVLVVEPCVKPLESALNKIANKPAERAAYTKDYLRAEIIGLKKGSHSSQIRMIGEIIDSLDNDPMTVARKNQFHTPHEDTAYRGYHAVWRCEVPDDQPLEGFAILAEVKFEHETQQDLNRLTRKIQLISRTKDAVQREFYDRCGTEFPFNYNRIERKVVALEELGIVAYDYIHAENGFNKFLDPRLQASHTPLSAAELNDNIAIISRESQRVNNMIASSGIELPKVKLPAYEPVMSYQ
jgi:hypothetical protein